MLSHPLGESMKNNNKKQSSFRLPQPRWKWLAAWAIVHPIAATPAVMMVLKVGPFAPPFVANGPVYMPAHLLAVLPLVLLIHGSGLLDPVKQNE